MEQRPPRLATQGDVDASIALDHLDRRGAVEDPCCLPTSNELAARRLQASDNVGEAIVSASLELGEDARLEEDLGEAEAVALRVEVECGEDGGARLVPLNEGGFGRERRSEDAEATTELGEGKAVGVADASDSNAFEDSVAAELSEDERDIDVAGRLLGVGHDTADKVGLRGVELAHEEGELLLVALADGAERALAYAGARTLDGSLGVDIIREEARDVTVGRLGEEGGEIVVEGILVHAEPTVGPVLDIASVMRDGEALLEARGGVLGVGRDGGVGLGEAIELLRELSRGAGLSCGSSLRPSAATHLLVGSLGHESLVVQARQDAHGVVGLDEVDGGLKLEAEVDELPTDLLARVLLLLENERLVVEELLKFLRRERRGQRRGDDAEKRGESTPRSSS